MPKAQLLHARLRTSSPGQIASNALFFALMPEMIRAQPIKKTPDKPKVRALFGTQYSVFSVICFDDFTQLKAA
ncbi:MAG: hypothetical protein ACOYJC_00920 [Christensenellales bacterium]